MENNLSWLQDWIHKNFSGAEENEEIICIQTLDNPGWAIDIRLDKTKLRNKPFQEINVDRAKDDWIFSRVRNLTFEGRCGPLNLIEILKIFRIWVDNSIQYPLMESDSHLIWLSNWYYSQCDGDWEHGRPVDK